MLKSISIIYFIESNNRIAMQWLQSYKKNYNYFE
jgi:hypothetical protein